MGKECCNTRVQFQNREELVQHLVKKHGGDAERTRAFVPRALQYLDNGALTREEFLENLCGISYMKIEPEDFWPLYDAYMTEKRG